MKGKRVEARCPHCEGRLRLSVKTEGINVRQHARRLKRQAKATKGPSPAEVRRLALAAVEKALGVKTRRAKATASPMTYEEPQANGTAKRPCGCPAKGRHLRVCRLAGSDPRSKTYLSAARLRGLGVNPDAPDAQAQGRERLAVVA